MKKSSPFLEFVYENHICSILEFFHIMEKTTTNADMIGPIKFKYIANVEIDSRGDLLNILNRVKERRNRRNQLMISENTSQETKRAVTKEIKRKLFSKKFTKFLN